MNNQANELFDSCILAGGFGKRLSPLTDNLPKPMLPINGLSAFEHNIRLLRKNRFINTAVTTMYLPEKIETITDDSGKLSYFREKQPLGSAGAIRQLKGKIKDCLLVISGDAFCDFDLNRAKEEFLDSNCDAAILLCERNDSGEYGSVCVNNGEITSLCEKPSVRDTLSNLINTGIYFIGEKALDLIPEDRMFDFARDLFPELLRLNHSIKAIIPDGHWFDIGSFSEYHQCNMWVSKGQNCIGKQVSLHPEAKIETSVIMNNCTIGNSVLCGCIVGEGVTIGNGCIIPKGCVIGPGVEIRDESVLAPSSIIETGSTVIGKALIDYFPKPKNQLILDDDAVIAEDNNEGYFVHLGRLLGKSGDIIAFAEDGGITLTQACELSCGVSKSGSNCTLVSGGNASLASFAASEYSNITAYISKKDKKTEVRLFSKHGMPFSREDLRKLSTETVADSKKTGSVYLLPHGALIKRYLAYLRDNTAIPNQMTAVSERKSEFLKECLDELSVIHDANGIKFSLFDNGEKAKALLPNGHEISYWQLILICCIEGKRNGIILPNDTPDAVERILRRNSVDVAFYGDSDSDLRKLAESDRLHRDGVLLSLTAKSIAEKKGISLEELANHLPSFSVITQMIFADRDRMSEVITKLRRYSGNSRLAGYDFGEGRVNVYASASGRFRLIAEATDNETAEEITLRAIDKLSKE